jgi:hypothetical protein
MAALQAEQRREPQWHPLSLNFCRKTVTEHPHPDRRREAHGSCYVVEDTEVGHYLQCCVTSSVCWQSSWLVEGAGTDLHHLQCCVTSSVWWQGSWLVEGAGTDLRHLQCLEIIHDHVVREVHVREACYWITRMVGLQPQQHCESQHHSSSAAFCSKTRTVPSVLLMQMSLSWLVAKGAGC